MIAYPVVQDDEPWWGDGQMTQSGCSVQLSASFDSSCSGTATGSTLQWDGAWWQWWGSGSCGGNSATGTLSANYSTILWSDGNSWERRADPSKPRSTYSPAQGTETEEDSRGASPRWTPVVSPPGSR